MTLFQGIRPIGRRYPMEHDHKLGLCGASLTTARMSPHTIADMTQVRDEIERIVIGAHILDNAPFKWITVSLRFGLQDEEEPHYEPINNQYGDLPLAIEI